MTAIKIEDIELKNYPKNTLELSIQLTPDGLSFCIYSRQLNKFLALIHNPECINLDNQIAFIDKAKEYFDSDYATIRIVYHTPQCTIAPAALFNFNDSEEMFRFSFVNCENQTVSCRYLPKTDNYIIFGVPTQLQDYLKKKFNNPIILTQTASFVDINITRLRLDAERPANKMFINMNSKFFDVMLAGNDRLLLYNTYHYKTSSDIVYYILNIFDQFKLDQEQTHIVVSGFVQKDDLAIMRLRKFVQFVFFESRNLNYNYFYKFQDVQSHIFYNLLNSIECE